MRTSKFTGVATSIGKRRIPEESMKTSKFKKRWSHTGAATTLGVKLKTSKIKQEEGKLLATDIEESMQNSTTKEEHQEEEGREGEAFLVLDLKIPPQEEQFEESKISELEQRQDEILAKEIEDLIQMSETMQQQEEEEEDAHTEEISAPLRSLPEESDRIEMGCSAEMRERLLRAVRGGQITWEEKRELKRFMDDQPVDSNINVVISRILQRRKDPTVAHASPADAYIELDLVSVDDDSIREILAAVLMV